MKNFIKSNLTAIVVVLLVAGATGLSAAVIDNNASKTEIKEKKVVAVEQWYSLVPTLDADPNNQTISGFTSAPDMYKLDGCAQFNNGGEFCTVLIRFASGIAPNLTNSKVQDALNAGGTIVDSKASEGYSRLP